jgi:hypothetical protein
MAILKRFVTCAAIVSLALAQSNNTALQIEAIQAHFSNAQLVPVPIPAFNPTAVLTVNFNGVGVITPGQLLTEARMIVFLFIGYALIFRRGENCANPYIDSCELEHYLEW